MTPENEETPESTDVSEEEEVINPKARSGTFKSLKLETPITVGAEEIYYLDFQEPGVKHFRKYGATGQLVIKDGQQLVKFDIEVIALYIEKLCGLGKDDANKLTLKDFERAKEMVLVFFPIL